MFEESFVVNVLLSRALVTAISSASFVRSNLEPEYSRFVYLSTEQGSTSPPLVKTQ